MSAPGKDLTSALDTAVRDVLAYLRTADGDAAADLDAMRRRELTRPAVVLVGETERGKSSLLNAVLGVPGLSPADAGAATSAYLWFSPGAEAQATVHLPGAAAVDVDVTRLRDWAVQDWAVQDWATQDGAARGGGNGWQGVRPARRIEVRHPAPLLQYLSLVDTPGVGGLDPAHTEIALDAAGHADALLFVADASAPLSRPELDFLAEAGKRVDAVVFALTKIDAYPGWRRIAEDNRALLHAHAPRFAAAPWFPVSARLAESALHAPAGEQGALVEASNIAELQHALVDLAGRGHLLHVANVLRAARTELLRLDEALTARIAATEADAAGVARARRQRGDLAARRRSESRQWSLALHTETQRARVEALGLLRTQLAAVQEDFTARVDTARGATLNALCDELDTALQAMAVRLSHDLQDRFQQVGERVLAQVFDDGERRAVLGRLNATLRHALTAGARRDGGGGDDNVMIALSAGGIAFMAGRGAVFGVSALGAGGIAAGGLLVPVAGIGLGVAAGGYVLWRRRVQTDRRQARTWLRDVLGEARAALSDEISYRFTDLQHALTAALDDAIERRLSDLDAQIAEVDAAVAQDRAGRARRRCALQADREALRTRTKQVDDVLVRARALTPTVHEERETR